MSHVCLHSPSKRRQGVACERVLAGHWMLVTNKFVWQFFWEWQERKRKSQADIKDPESSSHTCDLAQGSQEPSARLPFLPRGLANTCLVNSPRSSQPLPKVSICLITPQHSSNSLLIIHREGKACVNSHSLHYGQGPACVHTQPSKQGRQWICLKLDFHSLNTWKHDVSVW